MPPGLSSNPGSPFAGAEGAWQGQPVVAHHAGVTWVLWRRSNDLVLARGDAEEALRADEAIVVRRNPGLGATRSPAGAGPIDLDGSAADRRLLAVAQGAGQWVVAIVERHGTVLARLDASGARLEPWAVVPMFVPESAALAFDGARFPPVRARTDRLERAAAAGGALTPRLAAGYRTTLMLKSGVCSVP